MVIHKAPLLDERGNHKLDEAGKPRYLCGFRIAGGIDQDNSKSPQGYPDKVNLTIIIMIIIIIINKECIKFIIKLTYVYRILDFAQNILILVLWAGVSMFNIFYL